MYLYIIMPFLSKFYRFMLGYVIENWMTEGYELSKLDLSNFIQG